jgi:hypothetical protein
MINCYSTAWLVAATKKIQKVDQQHMYNRELGEVLHLSWTARPSDQRLTDDNTCASPDHTTTSNGAELARK